MFFNCQHFPRRNSQVYLCQKHLCHSSEKSLREVHCFHRHFIKFTSNCIKVHCGVTFKTIFDKMHPPLKLRYDLGNMGKYFLFKNTCTYDCLVNTWSHFQLKYQSFSMLFNNNVTKYSDLQTIVLLPAICFIIKKILSLEYGWTNAHSKTGLQYGQLQAICERVAILQASKLSSFVD